MKIVAVGSGKGGVGKSTVAVNLAHGLKREGFKVGVADLDITGSNVPIMMGIKNLSLTVGKRLVKPVDCDGIKVISVSLVLKDNDAPLLMRGEKRGKFVLQFIEKADWGDLDYLILDMPPGSGDEAIAILRDTKFKIAGVIIVTISSDVSIADVKKMINLCNKLKVKIFGIVSNMSYIACSDCGNIIFPYGRLEYNTFSKLGIKSTQNAELPFIIDGEHIKRGIYEPVTTMLHLNEESTIGEKFLNLFNRKR